MLDTALRQQEQAAESQPGPIFVIGSPRSGTSVLGWSLNEHRQLVCGPESEVFIQQFGFGRLVEAYQNSLARPDGLLAQKQVTLAQYAGSLGNGLDHLYRKLLGDKRWIDTTPRHVLMARELSLLLPGARFVLLIRNGVDVVNSLTHSGFNVWSAQSFSLAALTWRTYVKAGLEFAEANSTRCTLLRYEQLIEMDQSGWQDLLGFLQLEHEPKCKTFMADNVINSSFARQASATGSGTHDWSTFRQKQFELMAGPLMQQLDYCWR